MTKLESETERQLVECLLCGREVPEKLMLRVERDFETCGFSVEVCPRCAVRLDGLTEQEVQAWFGGS